jgi:hypothetical protein
VMDCASSFSPYELRKSVQAKYGLHDERDDCRDGFCALLCGCCMVCQDYKELNMRGAGKPEQQSLLTASSHAPIAASSHVPGYPAEEYPAYPTVQKM